MGCRSSSASFISAKGVLCNKVKPLGVNQRSTGKRAHMLEGHRVTLLRHDAAQLDKSIAQRDIGELSRTPKQQILSKSAQVDMLTINAEHASVK